MNIEIKLLKHQRAFLESKYNKVLLLAGRATGKSYVASIAAAMNMLMGKRLIVFAQTFSSLQRNIFAEIVNNEGIDIVVAVADIYYFLPHVESLPTA